MAYNWKSLKTPLINILIAIAIMAAYSFLFKHGSLSNRSIEIVVDDSSELTNIQRILVDFGKIYNDRRYEKEVKIINKSNKAVEITPVLSSCSCASIKLTSSIIDSTSHGGVHILYEPFRRSGHQRQELGLKLDNGKIKQIEFIIAANVIKALEYNPSLVKFSTFSKENESKNIDIQLFDNINFQIDEIKCPKGYDINFKVGDVLSGNNSLSITRKGDSIQESGMLELKSKLNQIINISIIEDNDNLFSVRPSLMHIFISPTTGKVVRTLRLIPKVSSISLDEIMIQSSIPILQFNTNEIINNDNLSEQTIEVNVSLSSEHVESSFIGDIQVSYQGKMQKIPAYISLVK